MRTLEENYDLLDRLVSDEKIYLDPSFPFERVCRLLGVRRRDMDALLQRELGLDGDTLFKSFEVFLFVLPIKLFIFADCADKPQFQKI